MMQRLIDQKDGSDPVLAEARRLLLSEQPLVPSTVRQARVRAALNRRSAQRGPVFWLLRPAVVAGVLIGLLAVASAMFGQKWLRHAGHQSVPVQVPQETMAVPVAPVPAPQAAPAPPLHPPTPAPLLPRPVREKARPAPQVKAPSTGPQVVAPQQPEAGPSSREAAMVLSAARALRRDHDAGRAGVLLDDYLQQFPDGLLAEEALALAIEAAAARGDERAAELGGKYLKRFPKGRFREAARRAQERFGD